MFDDRCVKCKVQLCGMRQWCEEEDCIGLKRKRGTFKRGERVCGSVIRGVNRYYVLVWGGGARGCRELAAVSQNCIIQVCKDRCVDVGEIKSLASPVNPKIQMCQVWEVIGVADSPASTC